MKIFRTRIWRGDIPWSERTCKSRRQWGFLKGEMGYYGITRMTLESFEIPEDAWELEQDLNAAGGARNDRGS